MIPRSDTTVIDGQFVSQRVSQVVEAIREYDPCIEVQWVPVSVREEGQAAFRLIYNPPNDVPYVMWHVKTEEEFDHRVLQKIMVNDQKNGQHSYDEFEAAMNAKERIAKQAWLDSLEEQHELAASILKSRKSSYKVNDDLIIKDGIPFNAARLG